MSELVLAAGSIAGAFTALALGRASSHLNPRPRRYYYDDNGEGRVGNNYEAPELEQRMILQAMERVHDYERAGRITGVEREQLLAKYRAQLDGMNSAAGGFGQDPSGADIHLFSRDLIALLDQRFAQINSKIEDLRSSMGSAQAQVQDSSSAESEEPVADKEMKIEKEREGDGKEMQVSQSRTESPPAVESIESSENDGSLEDIKKQIMQTLSRLEQAEVE